MVECPSLSRTILGRSPDWRPVMEQAAGCLASAWARLDAKVGDSEATRFLENAWGEKIPQEVIAAGLVRKAEFAHLS